MSEPSSPDSLPSMAELHRKLATEPEPPPSEHPAGPRPRPIERDDELLDELPATDHHLGGFAGWRATRKVRWILGAFTSIVAVVCVVILVRHLLAMRNERLHPLPDVEATLTPGSSREATYNEGAFRIGLSREEPYINVVHLPDRDITLPRFTEKAQFKVEVRDNKTVKLEVLTGEIVETLTRDDAEPLLVDD